MVPIFVMLTIAGHIGIRALTQRGKQIYITEEKEVKRIPWESTEEAFLRC